MKEPKRLLSQGATDFERQLLRAVANERPSALLRSRMQRGLGLVGPLAWASTVKAMLGSAAAKVTAVVGLGVLAVATVATLELVPDASVDAGEAPARAVSAAPAPVGEAASAVAEPAAAAPAEAAPAAAAPREAEGAHAPGAPSTPNAAPLEAASAPPAAEAAGAEDDRRLREEIALLDGARAALERGDREAARRSLRTYRERFPEGVLAREANLLRRRAEPARARSRAER